jgi:hypothetical protein
MIEILRVRLHQKGSSMALTVLASNGCNDGTCPTFFVDDISGDVYVRGYSPDGSETDVRIPRQDWAVLITSLGL